MSGSDVRYYEKRLAEELVQMERSAEREVQAVHRKLAELYRQRIADLTAGGPA